MCCLIHTYCVCVLRGDADYCVLGTYHIPRFLIYPRMHKSIYQQILRIDKSTKPRSHEPANERTHEPTNLQIHQLTNQRNYKSTRIPLKIPTPPTEVDSYPPGAATLLPDQPWYVGLGGYRGMGFWISGSCILDIRDMGYAIYDM